MLKPYMVCGKEFPEPFNSHSDITHIDIQMYRITISIVSGIGV